MNQLLHQKTREVISLSLELRKYKPKQHEYKSIVKRLKKLKYEIANIRRAIAVAGHRVQTY